MRVVLIKLDLVLLVLAHCWLGLMNVLELEFGYFCVILIEVLKATEDL